MSPLLPDNSALLPIETEEVLQATLTKMRAENRERKKRWRMLNAQRNKDNDLRCRVYKRAHKLFGKETSQHKTRWIEEEFARRQQKRHDKDSRKFIITTPGSCGQPRFQLPRSPVDYLHHPPQQQVVQPMPSQTPIPSFSDPQQRPYPTLPLPSDLARDPVIVQPESVSPLRYDSTSSFRLNYGQLHKRHTELLPAFYTASIPSPPSHFPLNAVQDRMSTFAQLSSRQFATTGYGSSPPLPRAAYSLGNPSWTMPLPSISAVGSQSNSPTYRSPVYELLPPISPMQSNGNAPLDAVYTLMQLNRTSSEEEGSAS